MAGVCLAKDDLQHDLTWMADNADRSVVLAQLQVAFFSERDNKVFSPCGRPFSCLKNLLGRLRSGCQSWLLLLLGLILLV